VEGLEETSGNNGGRPCEIDSNDPSEGRVLNRKEKKGMQGGVGNGTLARGETKV